MSATISTAAVVAKSKDAVRNAVATAIKAGVLKPEPCEVCGMMPKRGRGGKRLVKAHHADYNYPLAVQWLCDVHHFAWHNVYRATELATDRLGLSERQYYRLGLMQIKQHGSGLVASLAAKADHRVINLDSVLNKGRWKTRAAHSIIKKLGYAVEVEKPELG